MAALAKDRKDEPRWHDPSAKRRSAIKKTTQVRAMSNLVPQPQAEHEQMRAYPAQPQPQLSLLVKPPVVRPGWQPQQYKAGSEKYREHYNLPKQPVAEPDAEPLFSPDGSGAANRCAGFTPLRPLGTLLDELHGLQELHHQERWSGNSPLMSELGRLYAGDRMVTDLGRLYAGEIAPSEGHDESSGGNPAREPVLCHLAEPSCSTRPNFGSDEAFGNFYRGSRVKSRHAYTMLLRPDGGLPDETLRAKTLLGIQPDDRQ